MEDTVEFFNPAFGGLERMHRWHHAMGVWACVVLLAHPIVLAALDALEPFVDTWAIAGAANRAQRRLTSEAATRVAFFNAAKPLLVPALEHLDRKPPLSELDEKEQRLMNMLFSFVHVSLAVEVQGDAEAEHAQAARHLKITRATADRAY